MRAKLYKISVLLLLCLVLNKLAISCEEKNRSLDFIRGSQIEMATDIPEDSAILKEVRPYMEEVNAKVSEVLCYNPRVLNKNESELESSLGNLLADICYQAGDSILKAVKGRGIDFAVFNHGGMRAPINKGDVTVEDIFQLMPFENRLVIVELNPGQVGQLIEYLSNQKQAHPVSGIRLEMEGDRAEKVTVNGKMLDPSRNYYVLTIDYLQNGGGNMTFLTQPEYLYISDLKVRDALISNLRKQDTLRASLDGRFTAN